MVGPISENYTKIRRQFAARLPARLELIRSRFNSLNHNSLQLGDVQTLLGLVHSLSCTAATFGFPSVSLVAQEAESMLSHLITSGATPSAAQWQAILKSFEQISETTKHPHSVTGAEYLLPPETLVRLDRSPLIHVLEDDIAQAEYLSQILRANGFRIQIFSTTSALADACQGNDAERAAAVVVDMDFHDGADAALTAILGLNLHTSNSIPVLAISSHGDIHARLAALRAGIKRYLMKPYDDGQLVDILDTLTSRLPERPYRILLVDDDSHILALHSAILHSEGMVSRAITNPMETLDVVDEFNPDVIVLDIHMPEVSGPELAALLREKNAYTPILFLSAENNITEQLRALYFGGDDFLEKPIEAKRFIAAVSSRARRARQNRAIQRRLQFTLYEREREHLALNQHAIVSISNRVGRIIYANDKFCEISGYTREELLGKNHKIVKSGVHPPEFYRTLWSTISTGNTWQGEICNRRKDGKLYWVKSTIVPFLDDLGKPYQYVSLRTDITERKHAEAEAEEHKERLRRGQLFANIGTWDLNIATGEIYWTERVAPLFGYAQGETAATRDKFLDAIHPDDRQKVIDAINATIFNDARFDIEHRVVWSDGRVRWLLERGAVIRDAQGKAVQMLGVVQDIDDRKRAEIVLEEREKQLRETQQMALLGHWHADLTTGELTWSDEIYRIFGQDPATFKPSIKAFHAAVHPDDLESVYASERIAAETGLHDVVHRILRPNGEVRYVHEIARLEHDDQKHVLRLIGAVQDITQLKRTEQALITAKDEAERANRAKSDFLSNMSHELRTPMNAILGFSQLLELDDGLSEVQRGSVQEIYKAGSHLLELINEVLDLAKVESGHIVISLEPVQISPLVRECMALLGPLAKRQDVVMTYQGDDDEVVRADYTRLKQALINLMSNAIKYNRKGGRATVTVAPNGDGMIGIQVVDTGMGIPVARQAELFQAFHRLGAEGGDIEGTGIGLALTRRIIEAMGGQVAMESEEGVGSTFWISLARDVFMKEEKNTDKSTRIEANKSARVNNTLGVRRTVLYIEDNPANLKLVTRLLRQRPHLHLVTAHTPSLGLELAATERPLLILLDINLPGMDGYQVLAELKTNRELSGIPVVAVTANAMPRDIARGITSGFDEYIVKPIDVKLFLSILDRYLPVDAIPAKTRL